MKPNLQKLLSKSNINPNTVQLLLNIIFPTVVTYRRKETFFNFQFDCYDDEGQLRLVVRYGWSEDKGRWFFEPLRTGR